MDYTRKCPQVRITEKQFGTIEENLYKETICERRIPGREYTVGALRQCDILGSNMAVTEIKLFQMTANVK